VRLERLQLIGQFKNLKGTTDEPFEYLFPLPSAEEKGLNPICLVGLNGSGKSNLIELIADIFSYADRYFNKLYLCTEDLGYDFKITYTIDIRDQPKQIQLNCEKSKITINDESDGFMRLQYPSFLPSSIFAYSSGLNQGLSSIFAKNQIAFFDVIRKQNSFHQQYDSLYSMLESGENDQHVIDNLKALFGKSLSQRPKLFRDAKSAENEYDRDGQYDLDIALDSIPVDLPISHYLEHQSSQLAFIFLCISNNQNFSEFLLEEIKISKLISFKIDIHLNSYRNSDSVNVEVKRLFELSDSYEQSFDLDNNTGLLHFTLGDEFSAKLERLYADIKTFYDSLLFLSLLSAKKWSIDEKKSLRTSKYIKNVPNVSGGHPPIRLLNVEIELLEPNVLTTYDRLSDGEHQLIQLMSALLVDQDGQSLFIFDEPESHFNPEWRSEFLSLIEKYADISNSELIISTHSPFIVSACHANRMLHFEKEAGEVKISHMDVETYGAAFDTLLKSVFDFKALISKKPLNEIKELVSNDPTNAEQREKLLRALDKFGESFELNYKRNRLQNMSFDEPEPPRKQPMNGEG